MNAVRRGLLLTVVVGTLSLVPQSASAQGLWVGSWGWGGPAFVGGFGPGYYGPRRSVGFAPVGWGYPGFAGPVYRSASFAPSYYAPSYYGPSYYAPSYYAPQYFPPRAAYVGPSAHAIRVGNRVARRSWRRGWGW